MKKARPLNCTPVSQQDRTETPEPLLRFVSCSDSSLALVYLTRREDKSPTQPVHPTHLNTTEEDHAVEQTETRDVIQLIVASVDALLRSGNPCACRPTGRALANGSGTLKALLAPSVWNP